VTAAHCVNGRSTSVLTVYAGIQQLSQRTTTGQSRNVSTITVHPSYTSSAFINDVAVLTRQSTFNKTTTVGLCCMTSDTSLQAVGDHGVIVGWGFTVQGGPSLSDNLLQAVIQVQGDSSTCSTSSASNPSSLEFCASYDRTDSCQGDSDGPFMTSANNSWTCAGIVDFGSGCGAIAYNARVSAVRSFINGVVSG
jgi:secreted trypsin-like serine protease